MEVLPSKEDYWQAHLRYWNNIPRFPREYGLNRTNVYKEQYFFLLAAQYNRMNCYTSVYSKRQLEFSLYDTLFLEARDETKDIEQAIIDRDMICGILEKHNIGYRCFFSGGRSYHFYLDFEPIKIPNLSVTARNFVRDIDITDLLDMHVVGNRVGIGRIPYTYNERTDRYAVYSMVDDPVDLDFISVNGIVTQSPVVSLQPTEIFKYLRPDDDYEDELLKPAEVAFNGIYPDCVLNIMTKIRTEHHASHDERIHLAASLYKLGFGIDDIVDAFRETSDFSYDIAEYQVRDIVGSDYRPYSCARVKNEMNVCPYQDSRKLCHYIVRMINNR